jgi:predicted metal-dependent hydrolase
MSLRDTRSRWGSCSSDAKLMFSWRLIMAPEDILAYVAAHEVAHLKYMNHSKEFWETVEYLFGPYHKERTWLRQNGSSLHRYRFQS